MTETPLHRATATGNGSLTQTASVPISYNRSYGHIMSYSHTMKQLSNRLTALVALSCLSAPACSSTPKDNELSVRSPKGITVTADSPIARNYPRTECLDFRQKHKSIGFLCFSSSEQFTTDFGIAATASPDAQEHLQVTSGMSTHELKPIIVNGRRLFTAEVDCDDRDAPLYRATSTCHVAFMPMANAHFFYSNFILSNGATSTPGVDERTIMDIWKSLASTGGGHG